MSDMPASDVSGASRRAGALVLAATILASSLGFVDSTVVTVALPSLQESFGASFGAAQWVVNGYALMLAALIAITGGLGDRYGRRRVFAVGIIVFAVASIACALAPSIEALIVARVVQGIGAALLIPQSLAIISAYFPRERRGRAIGTWAAVSAATTTLGPPLGGFLIDVLDWRAAFWINIPLAALALWLTFRSVPESSNPDRSGRIDWAGSILAMAGFGLLAAGLTSFSNGFGEAGAAAYAMIGAGIVALGVFVAVERRVSNPVVPPSLFRSPVFTGTNVLTVFLYGCLAAILFLLPYELDVRRGLSPAQTGLTLVPFGVIIALGSRFAGGLADRLGPRPFLIVGPAVVAVGCAAFALAGENYWTGAFVPVLIVAFGMMLVVSPLTTAVMNSVPDSRSGVASSINNAASRIGGLLAVALIGACASIVYMAVAGAAGGRFGILPELGDAARAAAEDGFLTAYRSAMWFAAGWAAVAALASLIFLRRGVR